MDRKIVLSKSASGKLDKLLEYLEEEWSKSVRDKFIKKLDKALDIIKENPDSSPTSEIIKGLHRCVITKQTTLYYKYDRKRIYVVTIFDTRQDPGKLKKETRE